MASTNKTTNYELSQYVGSDKPTYLTDYNQDMSKIDAGIHAAKSEADTNATSIGDLTTLTTTAKSSLVAAANEIDADVATNTNNIATNTSNIATNTTHIGTVSNLTTTAKTDLVVAANEINAKVGNIANLETDTKTSCVAAINEIVEAFNLTTFTTYDENDFTITVANETGTASVASGSYINVARNDDGSLAKVYGYLNLNFTSGHNPVNYVTILLNKNTGLTPDSDITINALGNIFTRDGNNITNAVDGGIKINTNGTINFGRKFGTNDTFANNTRMIFTPAVLFVKDFGDVPPQE